MRVILKAVLAQLRAGSVRGLPKTGVVPVEFHRYLIEGQNKRNVGDYQIGRPDEISLLRSLHAREQFLALAERLPGFIPPATVQMIPKSLLTHRRSVHGIRIAHHYPGTPGQGHAPHAWSARQKSSTPTGSRSSTPGHSVALTLLNVCPWNIRERRCSGRACRSGKAW